MVSPEVLARVKKEMPQAFMDDDGLTIRRVQNQAKGEENIFHKEWTWQRGPVSDARLLQNLGANLILIGTRP